MENETNIVWNTNDDIDQRTTTTTQNISIDSKKKEKETEEISRVYVRNKTG